MKRLRLLLGDQLDPLHSWFRRTDPDTLYVLMEVRQETDYVLHHAQKILAIFAAMRAFARQLEQAGFRVRYLKIDDPDSTHSITDNLERMIDGHAIERVEYQAPDEWRLDAQLANWAKAQAIPVAMCDSEHFYTSRGDAAAFFRGRRRWTMEPFYRHMRQRHGLLVDFDGKPAGGRWNFDRENRKAWPGQPAEPADARPEHDHSALWRCIEAAGIRTFGDPSADRLRWPLNRHEAMGQLDVFIEHALNTKMLRPHDVVERAEQAWRDGRVPLASAEGFIRQVLGWREYVRGVYWARMPAYAAVNHFSYRRDLPAWFWTGETRMSCLHHDITQSLQHAHAHHIQRLMLTGNFALLAGLDPEQVHRWYLGIYIDAFEWVELPNTLGMSQFADGGMLATKPYIASANYIHRMSDYCAGCWYRRNERTGERACPFNALYWDFLRRERTHLASNPRLSFAYRQLDRMQPAKLAALHDRATALLDDLDAL